ncbi:MAG: hypothetical protein KDC12_12705 [Flavobacteriales bacterium]|nr:hypothetical protein [Flavobacteriales bacterium]
MSWFKHFQAFAKWLPAAALFTACQPDPVPSAAGNPVGADVVLDAPHATEVRVNIPEVIAFERNEYPVVPDGFKVTRFAEYIPNVQNLLVTPQGEVLAVQSGLEQKDKEAIPSENQIVVLADLDGDGLAESRRIFTKDIQGLSGMALRGDTLYFAGFNRVYKAPYKAGMNQTTVVKSAMELPPVSYAGSWFHDLCLSADSGSLYVGVGTNRNLITQSDEWHAESGRGVVWKLDFSPLRAQEYATGMRYPKVLALDREGSIWAGVRERSDMGDNLVPDYVTRVRPGGFYGWPWFYWGDHAQPKAPAPPDGVARPVVPDYALGAHAGVSDLIFTDGSFSKSLGEGILVVESGSWNRSELWGYEVVFIPREGDTLPEPIPFLSGFRTGSNDIVHGIPTAIAQYTDGSILVADPGNKVIWRVSVVE